MSGELETARRELLSHSGDEKGGERE